MFKKLLCFALALIIICSCSLTAFADMEGPYFEEFEVTVDNPDGIELYRSDWNSETFKTTIKKIAVIPNGTKLTITGDYIVDGVKYLYTTYGDEYGYIKVADVHIEKNDVVKPTKDDKVDEKFSVITINSDGAKLHSGPSNAYPEVASVPAGTQFEIEYVIGQYGAWAYVTYNGTSGWLHFYEYEDSYDCIKLKEEPGKLMVVDNATYLTKTPDTNSPKISEAIPYGTVLSYKHIYHEAKADIAYVEYNGVKGWLRTRDAFSEGTAYHNKGSILIINPDGLNVYSDAKDSDKVLCKIPYNTIVPCEYVLYNDGAQDGEISDYLYVSYNGIKGWVRLVCAVDDAQSIASYIVNKVKVTQKSIPVYSETSTGSSVICNLKSDNIVYVVGDKYNEPEEWYLIYNGEYLGWVLDEDNNWDYIEEIEKYQLPAYPFKIGELIPDAEPEFKDGYDNALPAPSILSIKDIEKVIEKATEELTEEISEETSESATAEAETQPAEELVDANTASPQILIILCVAAAVAGAITSAVIIIVVKKKRKKN